MRWIGAGYHNLRCSSIERCELFANPRTGRRIALGPSSNSLHKRLDRGACEKYKIAKSSRSERVFECRLYCQSFEEFQIRSFQSSAKGYTRKIWHARSQRRGFCASQISTWLIINWRQRKRCEPWKSTRNHSWNLERSEALPRGRSIPWKV